jgi:membrane protein DedA with SNARE-associated domain
MQPFAGVQAARGQFSTLIAIMAATVGSVVGGAAWYGLGRWFGLDRLRRLADRHSRWLPITSAEVLRADAWFQRWGSLAILTGRALPGVRGVIYIPAGVAAMPLGRFLIWSSLGAAAWSSILFLAGYELNAHYEVGRRWLNPASDGFLMLCMVVCIVRVVRYRSG